MRPPMIDKLQNDLIELIEKDESPSVTIEEAAKLLGQDRDCLRQSIASGTCPFGYGGTNPGGSRFGRVSKLALWNFLTKGIA